MRAVNSAWQLCIMCICYGITKNRKMGENYELTTCLNFIYFMTHTVIFVNLKIHKYLIDFKKSLLVDKVER